MKHRLTPRDPAADEFSEDLADLLHHRATVPAIIWSVLVLAASLAAWLDEPPPQAEQQFAGAAAPAPRPALALEDQARAESGTGHVRNRR